MAIRAPLFSDEDLDKEMSVMADPWIAGRVVRAWYEAKIASGELRVRYCWFNFVKTDHGERMQWYCHLGSVGDQFTKGQDRTKCPGCGAKIVVARGTLGPG